MTWRCRQCGKVFLEDPGPVHLVIARCRSFYAEPAGIGSAIAEGAITSYVDTVDCGAIEEVPDAA